LTSYNVLVFNARFDNSLNLYQIKSNMAFGDNIGYNASTLKMYFRGGVRKAILIIGGIALLMIFPMYYLGQVASNLYKNVWFNGKEIVQSVKSKAPEYIVGETQILPLENGQQDMYISINNKANTEIGYFPWVYNLQVLDANGTIINQNTVRSYLLPGSSTYVIAQNVDAKGVKLNLVRNPDTVEIPYNPNVNRVLQEPKVSIITNTVTPNPNGTDLTIRAVLKNNDLVTIGNVDVLYILRDSRQAVIGIGNVRFGGFSPNAEREVIVNYPKPKDKEAKLVEIRWYTNYLDKNNVVI
jgi:archaellum component FlaF (FlaF/FlaG flagellin family)